MLRQYSQIERWHRDFKALCSLEVIKRKKNQHGKKPSMVPVGSKEIALIPGSIPEVEDSHSASSDH